MERARARMSERADGAQWHQPLNQSNVQFFAEGHASYAAPRAAHPRDRPLAFLDGIKLDPIRNRLRAAAPGPLRAALR